MSTSAVEITLGTNNAALKSGLEAAKGQVESFKSQTSSILMGLFAGVGIEQLIEHFSHIQDQAEAFGTTAEAVQRVDQLASMAGASIDDVAKAMARLRVNSEALGKLGIDQGAFSSADMDQQLLMVAEALDKIEDPAQRVNMAIEVLGSRFAGKILPLLNMGAEEMKAFFESAGVASNDTVARLDAAGDKLTSIKNAVMVFAADIFGFVDKLMQSLGEVLNASVTSLVLIVSRLGGALDSALQGNFKNAKNELMQIPADLQQTIINEFTGIKDIWTEPAQPGSKKAAKMSAGAGDDEGGAGDGSKRLSVAERIAAIEEEHRIKKLDAETRLGELAEKRLSLEKELAELGSGNAEKKKQLEDQLVATAREKLATEDEMARNAEKSLADLTKSAKQEYQEWKKQQEKDRADAEKADKEANERVAKKQKEADRAKMDSLRAQERDLGFVSGIKQVGESGQRLAGVDYSVINAEAEKGIKIQEEIRDLMKVMTEKEYKLEIPDAS